MNLCATSNPLAATVLWAEEEQTQHTAHNGELAIKENQTKQVVELLETLVRVFIPFPQEALTWNQTGLKPFLPDCGAHCCMSFVGFCASYVRN